MPAASRGITATARLDVTGFKDMPFAEHFRPPLGAEKDRVGELMRREMCNAFELDPALAVDIGIGRDWLAAK